MAVALHRPVMGAEGAADRTVHPFFTSLNDRTHNSSSLERLESTQPDVDTSDSELQPGKPQDGLQEDGKTARRRRKRASDDQHAETNNSKQAKLSFGCQIAPDKTRDLETTDNDGPELAEDLHSGDAEEENNPRKRRKTCSPAPVLATATATLVHDEALLGWEEQLLQAGFTGSSPPVVRQSTPKLADKVEETPKKPVTPAVKLETPPKRVMKLRTDGRLVSPKTKTDADGKSRSKQGPGGSQIQKHQKIVVLRYRLDEDPLQEITQKVADVLSGKIRMSEPGMIHPQPAKVKPVQPAKTHPFFTGKIAQIKADNSSDHAQDDSDAAKSNRDRNASPQRKPTAAATSWAGFGSTFAKRSKILGSSPSPWPSRDMLHIRGLSCEALSTYKSLSDLRQRRLKGSEPRLSISEDVLDSIRSIIAPLTGQSPPKLFHRPRRRLMTGPELQRVVRARLTSSVPLRVIESDSPDPSSEDELALLTTNDSRPHRAVVGLFEQLRTSFSAFDEFECEQREWAHKYAPKSVDEVLRQGSDLLLLRDWLLGLTLNSVNNNVADSSEKTAALKKLRAKRKKRKAEDELDDFIVSTDEESDVGEDLSEAEIADTESYKGSQLRRLSPRNISKTGAVVLSGPHGSGKTACVYAVAAELGFEVFEINSSVRRSGRDVLEKVGDMTRNHLVEQSKETPQEDANEVEATLLDPQADIDSGRQSTMNAFFQSNPKSKKSQPSKQAKKDTKPVSPPKKRVKKQRQSLVLLEEVDILFEEDKHFWTTVISMLLESRRPVVLTCSNESLLPVDELSNVAALHVPPVPEHLAVDYLLLVAANEGHLLSRKSVVQLYKAQNCDLRSAMEQLNFLCQMALGDAKGGLEWMLIRSNHEESHNRKGEPLRVISEDTVIEHMPVLMSDSDQDTNKARAELDQDSYAMLDAYTNWGHDPEDWLSSEMAEASHEQSIGALRGFELATDALSAADTMPGSSLLEPNAEILDPTYPPLTDKERSQYPEGHPLLDTPLRMDQTSLSLSVVLSLKLLARPLLSAMPPPPLTPSVLAPLILNQSPLLSSLAHTNSTNLTSALSSLSIPPPSTVFTNSSFRPSPSLLPSTGASTLATDIAPFVRSIVAADLSLEQERIRLSGLLSQGGRDGKRARTTRAARAALEGGVKESTRKERWFGTEVNYRDILATEGPRWGETRRKEVARRAQEQMAARDAGRDALDAVVAAAATDDEQVETQVE